MPNKQRMIEMEETILGFLKDNRGNYYTISDLSNTLPINKHEHKYIKNILNKLARSRRITKRGKKFTVKSAKGSPGKQGSVVGVFDATSLIKGYSYAFVKHDDGDILIDSEDIANAVHNDKVLVELRYKKRGLLYGSVVKVVERATERFTGNIIAYRGKTIFVPDLKKLHINFEVKYLDKATLGDKVVVKVVDWGEQKLRRKPSAKVEEVLGKAGEKDVEELAIFKQFDLPLDFPEEVDIETEAINEEISDDELGRRQDYRSLLTITIDPATAKDYDDAISLTRILDDGTEQEITEDFGAKKPKGYRLYVHIADVSHYLRTDSALFSEAVERGNSFYFPRHVVPMLPFRLSNKICSLRPDEDKLTVTVVTDFNERFRITEQSAYESVIRSSFRLNYDEVDLFFTSKGGNVSEQTIPNHVKEVPVEVHSLLSSLRELSSALSRKRYEKGYIPFHMPEMEVEFDEQGKIKDLHRSKETESHKMIENCMLIANEYVAALLAKKTGQSVYRVHEEPELEDFEKMLRLLRYYKITSRKETSMQKTIQNLLTDMPTDDFRRVFDFIILRTMKKARYDTRPLGHFGLAAKNYTHFTSPIRRVCDLTVHHLLRQFIGKEASASEHLFSSAARCRNADNQKGDDNNRTKSLSYIAERASSQELLADSVERETERLYKRMYMQDKIGEVFDSIVVSMNKNSIRVELNSVPVTGQIVLESLKDDYYRFYPEYMELIGRRNGKVIRLLDRVKVRLESIDLDLNFAPLEFRKALSK